MPLTLIDAEATVKTWAKAETHIRGAVSDRVFYATPQENYDPPPGKSPSAWVNLSLPTETHQADDLGLQLSLVQFDCWGRTKLLAAAAALAVQAAARQLSLGAPVVVGSAVIVFGDVQQKRWLPDPTTNMPRYVVDVLFAIRGPEGA